MDVDLPLRDNLQRSTWPLELVKLWSEYRLGRDAMLCLVIKKFARSSKNILQLYSDLHNFCRMAFCLFINGPVSYGL